MLILASVDTLSYRRVVQEDAEWQWIEHTHVVLGKLDAIRYQLRDLATRDEAYVVARDRALLATFPSDASLIRRNLADLHDLTSDNSTQQATLNRIEPLVAAMLASLQSKLMGDTTRNRLETSGAPPADRAESLVSQMYQEEQRLLADRRNNAASTARAAKAVIVFGYLLALLLLSVAGFAVLREMRMRAETAQALETAEERYRLLFNASPLPAWVYDTATLAFLDANPAAISNYGYSREEFLSLTIKDIRPPEDVPAVVQSVASLSASAEDPPEWRHRRHRKKDGTIFDIEGISHPLVYDGRSARYAVAFDVTGRKKAEEAMRLSEERFRLMISNVKDYAILMLDPQGRVINWNEGAERIKGYRSEEILGQHFSCFYPAEEARSGKPTMVLKEAVRRGRFEDEGWRIRKDGSRFWANVVVTALHDEAGRLRGFVKVTRDVTERKKAEQEILRRSAELDAANKELEAFSYSVSHDLRAPLRGIDGFSQALLEDYAPQLGPTGADYLQRVRSAAQRMAVLIDDLLSLARVTRAEMRREPIDLTAIALAIAADLRSGQPDRRVDFVVAPSLRADGDARLMRVVLENLLGNSWKFTSKRDNARIEVARSQTNGANAFFVRDNGAGFNQAYAHRLFGAFQRLHGMNEFPGTGIGLATVQRIVHRHGGKVWAEGTADQGATFYFTL